MKSILVEGGPATLNQYIVQKAFNRTYAFIAPVIMGDGLGYSDDLQLPSMSKKVQLKNIEKLDMDDDTLLTALV